jgi:hypothetical protein
VRKVPRRAEIPAKKSVPADTVDDYLAAVPGNARAALARLRKAIKAAAAIVTGIEITKEENT